MHYSSRGPERFGSSKNRSEKGQAALALNLIVGVFVMGLLFTFAYELTRFLLAREQLKTIVQSSALAGEATILSTTQGGATARQTAQQTALNIFRRNAILGGLLSSATMVTSPTALSPAAGQTQLAIEWVDPVTRTNTSPTSSVLRLTAAYNYSLFSANFLGTKAVAYTMSVSEIAALPKVDIVVLMDESGSMDDQTPVTSIQRIWNYGSTGPGATSYTTPNGGGGNDTVGTLVCAAPMGTALNALPPQNLEAATWPPHPCTKYFSEVGYPNDAAHQTQGLRGVTNTGSPPGNAPKPPPPPPPGAPAGSGPPPTGPALGPFGLLNGSNPATAGPQWYNGNTNLEYLGFHFLNTATPVGKSFQSGPKLPQINLDLIGAIDGPLPWEQPAVAQGTGGGGSAPVSYPGDMFTDLVVNIDGNGRFGGYISPEGHRFSNPATLLEASRGNLENGGVYTLAAIGPQVGAAPMAGYQQAYMVAAAQQVLPQAVAHTGTSIFMNKLINSTDAHFGLVTFSDRAGISPTDVMQNFNVSWVYSTAGAANFPLPNIKLSPSSNNYNAVQSWVTPPTTIGGAGNVISVNGGTNTADALQKGIDQLTDPTLVRRGAMKAIILVTDGVPSRDIRDTTAYLEGANSQAQADAITQANRAKAAGIPVYVVAIAQDSPTIGPALDEAFSETVPGSISNTVGYGSKYYRVDWVDRASTQSKIDATFGNIARQLTTLVR